MRLTRARAHAHARTRSPHARRVRASAGFTLVELLLSAALMALILGAGYACLHAAFAAQTLLDPRLQATQTARSILQMMSADLRAACAMTGDSAFIGLDREVNGLEADTLHFASHHFTPRNPSEGDYCVLSYSIESDPASGLGILWRRRHPGLPLPGSLQGRKEQCATGVRQLRLEYYDGFKWHDEWGDADKPGRAETSRRVRSNASGLPDAVRVTLALDASPVRARAAHKAGTTNEPPLVFQTVARLVLAAAANTAPAASTPSGTGPAASASPSPPN